MTYLLDFLASTLLVPLTLLPIINPLGSAPIFVAMTRRYENQSHHIARQIGVNTWIIITASMLVGSYVLDAFGISLPIVRIAGGLLVAATGWRLLDSSAHDEVRSAVAEDAVPVSEQEMKQRTFFPMSFPLTTGPGSIAASIALGTKASTANSQLLSGIAVAVVGAAITAAAVFVSYRYAPSLLKRLGEIGSMVVVRLAAFILLCIGIGMIWAGWAELNGLELRPPQRAATFVAHANFATAEKFDPSCSLSQRSIADADTIIGGVHLRPKRPGGRDVGEGSTTLRVATLRRECDP